MANEAVIVELLGKQGDPIQYTVADGVGIEKGTIMQFGGDPRRASAASADGDLICGIAAAEKVANDGSTSIPVYTNGIFDLKIAGGEAAVLGESMKIASAGNLIGVADDDTIAKQQEVVGYSMETGSASETVQVRVLK